MERVDRPRSLGSCSREPRVGGVGFRERPVAVDREPGIECPVLALR